MAAKAGFEHETLQSKGIDSTNEPPCPTNYDYYIITFIIIIFRVVVIITINNIIITT